MGMMVEDSRLRDGWEVELRRESACIHCPEVICYEDGLIEIDYDDVDRLRDALDVIDSRRGEGGGDGE